MIRLLLRSQMAFFFAYALFSGAVFAAVLDYKDHKAAVQMTMIMIQLPVTELSELKL